MKYRPLKTGEYTKATDEKKISGPNEPEEWETSVLSPAAIRINVEGMYRRPCEEDTYRLFRACEVVMEFAKKFCLKEFFHGPLGVLFRMQEDNVPAYDPKDGKGK